MLKILLFSTLLMLVYSWEEFKQTFRTLVRGLIHKQSRFPIDRLVSNLIVASSVPIGLAYYLGSASFSAWTYAMLAAELLVISLLAAGTGVLIRRLRHLPNFDSREGRAVLLGYTVAGMFLPTVRALGDLERIDRKSLAKFTFFLSLPPFAGLALKFGVDQSVDRPELLPNLDILITIAVIGLFINITIDFLKHHFRAAKFNRLGHYARVLLGIILAVSLLLG